MKLCKPIRFRDVLAPAGKYLKPYQGLKQFSLTDSLDLQDAAGAGKYLKPYQGLKRDISLNRRRFPQAGKYLKPYQGLKLPSFLA